MIPEREALYGAPDSRVPHHTCSAFVTQVTPLADNARLMKTVDVQGHVAHGAMTAPQASQVRWKPNVTVAAVIERDGKFLLPRRPSRV
jgi:hypothetical protein